MTAVDHASSQKQRTILVTDSGLGGMSVFNDIANRIEKASPWEQVRLIYFNAWPAPHRGYNHYQTQTKRIRVFTNALERMAEYRPNQILIACNTLSVIYPQTPFSRTSPIETQGIVDLGVEMVFERLTADPMSKAIILGTPTTTNARIHENRLVAKGISPERIINIPCTNLAGWIEREPFSPTVEEIIHQFVEEAALALGDFTSNAYAALCCTHFGYRQSIFKAAFAKATRASVTLLNPNSGMAQTAFETASDQIMTDPDIEMRIVSKAEWSLKQIEAYLKLLPDLSSATAKALKSYRHDEGLFSVEEE